jgi:hypothetical protein
MRKRHFSIALIAVLLVFSSCKMFGRAAAKYWTKKQIKEFVANCESNAGKLIGEEKAKKYCDCAVDVVAEKYQNYEDVKKASIREVLKIAKDCK